MTQSNARFGILAITLLTAACAAMNVSRGQSFWPLNYQFTDDPTRSQLLLTYRNVSPEPVCVGPENWPSNGVLLNDGTKAYVEVARRRFFLKAEQDYCPNCTRRIEPGQTTVESINYKRFGLPMELWQERKTLALETFGYRCG